MSDTAKRRDTKPIGVRPFRGRRFVQTGKVRIEWWPGGRRKSKTIGPNTKVNRDYADSLLEDALRRAREAADGRSASNGSLSLGDLLHRHLEDAPTRRNQRTGELLRPPTLALYADHVKVLREHFREVLSRPARLLRRPEVRAFITAKTKEGWSDKSIATVVDYLKSAYSWAVDEVELLDANPIARVKTPSRKGKATAYTVEERALLLAAVAQLPDRAWRFKTMAILESLYGARALQVTNLRWTDIDFDAEYLVPQMEGKPVRMTGRIKFRQDAPGSKGQPDRLMPMLPGARAALLEAWNRRHDDHGYVLWGWWDPSVPVTYDGMNASLRALEAAAGVTHVQGRSFHAFRRVLATALAESQGGPKAAAEWIGDTLAVAMSTYIKETPTSQAAAAKWISNGLNRGVLDEEPRLNRASPESAEKSEAASA